MNLRPSQERTSYSQKEMETYHRTKEQVRGALTGQTVHGITSEIQYKREVYPCPFLILQRNSPGLAADPLMEKGKHVSETLGAHEPFEYFR